jgi:hypothetical protein
MHYFTKRDPSKRGGLCRLGRLKILSESRPTPRANTERDYGGASLTSKGWAQSSLFTRDLLRSIFMGMVRTPARRDNCDRKSKWIGASRVSGSEEIGRKNSRRTWPRQGTKPEGEKKLERSERQAEASGEPVCLTGFGIDFHPAGMLRSVIRFQRRENVPRFRP